MLLKFRDFPEIPLSKRFRHGKISTIEQDISLKTLNGQFITNEEHKLLSITLEFYNELFSKLKTIDYDTFLPIDFVDFKNYLEYALPIVPELGNFVECPTVTRVVRNESVLKAQKTLPNLQFLSYPTTDIVKKINRYNRANTPDTNVFYGSYSLDSALMELRPTVNEMITIGVWEKIDIKTKVYCYPIIHGKEAIEMNSTVRASYQSFQHMKESVNHFFIAELSELFLDFLGHEYSKKVETERHYDYFFSAVYSENIFENEKINAIIYPSVQFDYISDNLAIRPSYFDKNYRIQSITELIITETNYDKRPNCGYTGSFFIKANYNRHIKDILTDGTLIWKDPITVN